MNRQIKLLPYSVAALTGVGLFVTALAVFFPEPSQGSAPVENSRTSVSPRIAAWQERIAEEKLYAEKEARKLEAEKTASLAAQAKWRETINARSHTRVVAEDPRARQSSREVDRERVRAKQQVRQVSVQRQRPRQFEKEVAMGYAPEPDRARFNNIYSAMREMRGGN